MFKTNASVKSVVSVTDNCNVVMKVYGIEIRESVNEKLGRIQYITMYGQMLVTTSESSNVS